MITIETRIIERMQCHLDRKVAADAPEANDLLRDPEGAPHTA